jgi:hypothetical protein
VLKGGEGIDVSVPAEFEDLVVIAASGCWYWKGARWGNNPVYQRGKVRRVAYQYAWELLNGPMPAEHGLYRLCYGICCANPAHRLLLPKGLGRVSSRQSIAKARRKLEKRWRNEQAAAKYGLPVAGDISSPTLIPVDISSI